MNASWELPPVPLEEEHAPGAGRRNWVYREMAMLDVEPLLGLDPYLWAHDAEESKRSANAESNASVKFKA